MNFALHLTRLLVTGLTALLLSLASILFFYYSCSLAFVQQHYYLSAIILSVSVVMLFLWLNYRLTRFIAGQLPSKPEIKTALLAAQICFGLSIAVIGVNYYLQYAASLNAVIVNIEQYTGSKAEGKTLCLHLSNYSTRPDLLLREVNTLNGSTETDDKIRTYVYDEAVFVMPATVPGYSRFSVALSLTQSNEADRKARRSGSSPADWENRFRNYSPASQQYFEIETGNRANTLAAALKEKNKPLLLLTALDESPEITRSKFGSRVFSVAAALLGVSLLVTGWAAFRRS
ncbi:MAG: hypothetical protein IM638_01135 [Bacteroidetes bacterium]|nr:hypothetical protein [Bacteroidota bacterium]